MFYPLGKKLRKTLVGGGRGQWHPPPTVVRPRVKSCNIFSVSGAPVSVYIGYDTVGGKLLKLLAEVYRSKISINRFSCLDHVKREITFFDPDTFFSFRWLGLLPWKHNKIMRSTRGQLCFSLLL